MVVLVGHCWPLREVLLPLHLVMLHELLLPTLRCSGPMLQTHHSLLYYLLLCHRMLLMWRLHPVQPLLLYHLSVVKAPPLPLCCRVFSSVLAGRFLSRGG